MMAAYSYENLRPGIYVFGTKKKLVRKPTFRHYKRWTHEEMMVCADFSKSDEVVADELCRTVSAVVNRRWIIRWAAKHKDVIPTT